MRNMQTTMDDFEHTKVRRLRTVQTLKALAQMKAEDLGHHLTTWHKTFHRQGWSAHCEQCWRMAYVLMDMQPPLSNGKALEEKCPS